MEDSPYISVVILTAKRPDKLKNCLQSLKGQIFRDFEIIVVDNNPSQETESIINETSLDACLIDNSGVPSYAEARNKGIETAKGEYIAFLDDDCMADPGWLLHLSRASSSMDAIGGIVLPLKSLPFPDWWEGSLNWLLGLSVPGLLDSESPGQNYPQTANMMIKRDLLLKEKFQELGGGFSQKRSRRYAGREDVELWRRLRLKGSRCVIELKAVVYHDIPLERLKFTYLLRRAFNDGLAYYRREKKTGYAEWAITDIVIHIFRIFKGLLPGKKKSHSPGSNLIWAVRQTGFLAGYLFFGKFSFKRIGRVVLLFMLDVFKYGKSVFKRFVRKRIEKQYHKHRQYSLPQTPPGSLLIAACGFLGDMILLAPILKGLRDSLPDTKITLLGYGNADAFFRNSSLVDELIICPSKKKVPEKKRRKIIRRSLEKRDFDVTLIPYWHNAPVRPLFYTVKAPVITFESDVGFPRRLWYDLAFKRIKKDYSIHEIRNLKRLVSQLGIQFKPVPYRLSIPPDIQERIDDLISQLTLDSDPIILLHGGAGQSWKAWPLENWDILAGMIYKKFKIKPAFIGDEGVGKKIENLVTIREGQGCNLCFAGDLTGLAALIKRGDILISNDSGPKHIAMAIGTPTITLYGTMDERRWGALWDADRHFALRAVAADLSPEELLDLPPDYSMACISPEMVLNILQKYLKNVSNV